jgi:hypothetical protein
MLINMEIYEQRWTVRDVSLVPFARSKLLSRISRVSRCSAPIGHPYPIYCRLRSVLRSKTGDRRRALVRGVIASGCSCLFRWRSDQKAAFASGDFIDVRLASRDGGQSKSCCDNPCSVAIARPEPARPDAAIWIPQSCWAGGALGSLLDGEGPSHQGTCFSLYQNY